ncbi:hypothetical protein DIPPA_08608 [Diplonema papillatum]|nr:hypothetical protein DIPPA_08608 [Diplonema papillatum]
MQSSPTHDLSQHHIQEADAFDLPRGTFGMKDDSDHSSEFAFVPFDETVSGTHNEVVAPEKRSDPPLISDEVKAIVDAITAPAKGILYHIQHFLSMTYGWYMKYWHNIRKRDWAKLQMTLVILCQLHLLLVIPFAFVFIEISCTDCSPEDSYSDRKFRSFISWMVMLSSAFQTSFGLAAIFYENIVMLVAFNCLTFVLAARYIFNMVYYLADSNSAALVVVPPIFEISYMLVYLVVSCIVGQGFNRLMCYRVGGLPHIVRMYKMLQVFSALVKVDMLFIGLSAIVAGFWYITTTAGWIALFVSLPIALALFTLSIRWTKHEQRQPLIVFIIFALAVFGAQAYMIYRLYIHEDHTLRRKLDTGYHATVITLTAAAAVRVAMLISLLLCVRSFGRGLKEVLKDDNETTLFGFIPRVEI